MHARSELAAVVNSFSRTHLLRFFRTAHSGFKPSDQDFSHYDDRKDSRFTRIEKLGEIEFDEIQRFVVVTARTKGELTERNSKKRQYELGKKILKHELYDAGIFVFHDDSGHFRFSLIVAQYFGKQRQYSNFRRYTYFVSPDYANKTFLNQVGRADFSSIDKILQAFSIEAVSNEFYNEFKPKFDAIAEQVQGTDDVELKQDFALLFVIRIIFLGFVQKKGWLGKTKQFIQNYWKEYQQKFSDSNQFYLDWLEPFFFQALNSPPGRKVLYQNNDFSPETEAILQNAPFLNGELFKEKTGVDDLDLWIPDAMIDDFFQFLFQYNFTIEENKLFDEELELNPEFLGLIFERLTNKDQGAVYTPRVEVDFMCRMALVKWLGKNSSCEQRELYRLFFREKGQGSEFDEDQKQGDFSVAEIRELVQLLQNVTICDPAAGSGAFEVGALQVLDEILENLTTRNNGPQELQYNSDYDRKKEIIARSLYGVEVKHWAVWINQLRLWLTLFIDMPPEFRRLPEPLLPSLNFKVRCGDALVQRVGSKLFPVQGHAELPASIKRKITELKKMKHDFFYNRGKDGNSIRHQETLIYKEILDDEIQKKQNRLTLIRTQENQMDIELDDSEQSGQQVNKQALKIENEIIELREQRKSLKDSHPLIWNIEFAEVFYDKGGFDVIIGNPPYVRQESISDPLYHVTPREYKTLLADVIRMDYPHYFKPKTKISAKSDLYVYFYVRSLHLLNSMGVHAFICSNSWLDVQYGVWMQEFLLHHVRMAFVIDNHAKRSFSGSDVNTVITLFHAPDAKSRSQTNKTELMRFVAFKQPFEDVILTENLLELEDSAAITTNDRFRVYPVTAKQLLRDGTEFKDDLDSGTYIGDKWGGKYLRAPDIFFTILKKGAGKLVKLKDVAEVRRGITSGANDFFYLKPLGPGSKSGLTRVINGAGWEGEIEDKFLKPVIKSPRECSSNLVIPEDLQFKLFMCNKTKDKLQNTYVLKYIEWGEENGFNNVTSLRTRRLWWSLPNKERWKYLWPMVHNERIAIFYNKHSVYVDHNLFEINFKDFPISFFSVFVLFSRELFGRSNLGEGALKTEGIDIKKFLIVDPTLISSKYNYHQYFKTNINSIFFDCGINPESDIPIAQQEPEPLPDRAQLDNIVFDVLNLTVEERKEVYRAVCQLVWNRIQKARSV
ncbi:MAG: DNA methyltransferase [candidate division KSB1 bacterium]|nr:DNA methyltransferase [candidate division KSB1 bacterium]